MLQVQLATMTPPTPAEAEVLSALFQEHSGRIFRIAYRLTGNASDAEDVLQTIFLRLLRRDEAPDLSMVGYAAGPRVGAVTYDVAHTYAIPVALALVGVFADADLALQIALVWAAHIGVDRAIGYGLKYPTGFRDTHLQRV